MKKSALGILGVIKMFPGIAIVVHAPSKSEILEGQFPGNREFAFFTRSCRRLPDIEQTRRLAE